MEKDGKRFFLFWEKKGRKEQYNRPFPRNVFRARPQHVPSTGATRCERARNALRTNALNTMRFLGKKHADFPDVIAGNSGFISYIS